MPHSDDFGLEDDDSAFLEAATQVEASQRGGFDLSPRPTKRRRVRRRQRGPPQLDGNGSEDDGDGEVEWSETDDEAHSPAKNTQYFQQSTAVPSQTQATNLGSDPENYYLPGELNPEENAAKVSRFKIHVPVTGGQFPNMLVTQTQHGLDEDPAAFRGPIWKKPPVPPPPTFNQFPSRNSNSAQRMEAMTGVGRLFQSRLGQQIDDDDAAFAARLQAEEDAIVQRQRAARTVKGIVGPSFDMSQDLADLADLPSDAFSSSSPEKSPAKVVIEISSQPSGAATRAGPAPRMRGPQTGLRQLDLHGMPATQDMSLSQAAKKKHAWPLANKEEPPTHHKLDAKEMESWVYPTNLGTVRDYQYNIVSRSLFHNTLVALPTGLGKTFIAATVMLNYYRWTKDAQIVFMAPTKPLIAQQLDACYGIVGIPRRDTILMTGETTPAIRADEWLEKRVFFMTPQTVINDLKTGICDPKRIVLLVVDEAHKATGGYAYTEVISFMRRFNPSFRVLALTATPGSTVEAVQAVIDNLGIARVELRTEQSIDIRQYTHEKHTETEIFDYSEEQLRIMDLFSKALGPSVEKLNGQNAYWSRDPMALSAYGLTQSRQKWMQSEAGRKAPQPVKGMINAIFTVLSSLAHNIGLLKFHGIGPFYSGVLNFEKDVMSGQSKGKTAAGIANSEHFTKMMSTIRTWTNNPEFIGHPKLEYLREVVLNHFLDAGEGAQGSDVPPSATRVMVFASYRDSTEEICRVLKRNEPMIRPHVFVGQAASKGSEGMDQKRQNAVIQDFKSGKYNCLVATSIGEEGLDIGTVDLIVCYDASSSPIRMLQRIGRTGRKRVGQVRLLLMKDKEEKDYAKAQDNYAYIQKTIADEDKYAYRDDQSPRILPREVRPIPDKRPVEIPVENSQPVDLNERARKGKGKGKTKRPPKKFHMPDSVRTGFVKASKLGSDDDGEAQEVVPKKAAAKKKQTPLKAFVKARVSIPSPEPEAASLPYITDVVLNDAQQHELEDSYARAADGGVLHAIDASMFPASKFMNLGRTRYVGHGRMAQLVERTMRAVHDVDGDKLQRYEDILNHNDLRDAGPGRSRMVSPEAERPLVKVEAIHKMVSPPVVVTKPRGRPKKVVPISDPESSDAESAPPARAPPPAAKKARAPAKRKPAAPRKTPAAKKAPAAKKTPAGRNTSYGDDAQEGASSSPEPTPAEYAMATQGIDLGSRDTSGEEEEEEMDSEMEAFIAKSDEVEGSSSLPGTPAKSGGRLKGKRRLQRKARVELSDVEEIAESGEGSGIDVDEIEEEEDDDEPVVMAAVRKRRIVEDSDSDE